VGERVVDAIEMALQEIEAAAVDRHRRRVGQCDAVCRGDLQALVLALGVAAVGLEEQRDVREVWVAAEVDQVREARAALGLGWAVE
jgi:hypothetical protein